MFLGHTPEILTQQARVGAQETVFRAKDSEAGGSIIHSEKHLHRGHLQNIEQWSAFRVPG